MGILLVKMFTYTHYVVLVAKIKVVQFLLEAFKNLTMPGHVSGQNKGDNSLKTWKESRNIFYYYLDLKSTYTGIQK